LSFLDDSQERIAIDEKRNKDKWYESFHMGAADLEDEKVIAAYVSYGRSYFEAMRFL